MARGIPMNATDWIIEQMAVFSPLVIHQVFVTTGQRVTPDDVPELAAPINIGRVVSFEGATCVADGLRWLDLELKADAIRSWQFTYLDGVSARHVHSARYHLAMAKLMRSKKGEK
jgi:hypothetical protein